MRARPITLEDGSTGHLVWCPGCQSNHLYDGRWTFSGSLDRPTFRASYLVPGGDGRARCHSYVTDGWIEFLPDSTHALAGQKVELDELD